QHVGAGVFPDVAEVLEGAAQHPEQGGHLADPAERGELHRAVEGDVGRELAHGGGEVTGLDRLPEPLHGVHGFSSWCQMVAASLVPWSMARFASSSAATSAPPMTCVTTPLAIRSSATSRRDSWPAQITTVSTFNTRVRR